MCCPTLTFYSQITTLSLFSDGIYFLCRQLISTMSQQSYVFDVCIISTIPPKLHLSRIFLSTIFCILNKSFFNFKLTITLTSSCLEQRKSMNILTGSYFGSSSYGIWNKCQPLRDTLALTVNGKEAKSHRVVVTFSDIVPDNCLACGQHACNLLLLVIFLSAFIFKDILPFKNKAHMNPKCSSNYCLIYLLQHNKWMASLYMVYLVPPFLFIF